MSQKQTRRNDNDCLSTSSSNQIISLRMLTLVVVLSLSTRVVVSAYSTNFVCRTSTPKAPLYMAPGGWGIGTPNEMQDEEFSNTSSNRQRRRRRRRDGSGGSESVSDGDMDDFVAYDESTSAKSRQTIVDPAQFNQKVTNEINQLRSYQKKDLLEVAKLAGLGSMVTPKVNAPDEFVSTEEEGEEDDSFVKGKRLGKFEDVFTDDEDDTLDVRVQFDE